MIRHILALCNNTLEHISDEAVFQNASDGFNHYSVRCPNCGASGKLSRYTHYKRWLMSYSGGKVRNSRISPIRFVCASCGETHALLTGNLVPYSSYSLSFMLTVLIAYFTRITTVQAVCDHFEIAVSTMYVWRNRLFTHKGLALGALLSLKTPALDFLKGLFQSDRISDYLSDFFTHYGFSFMQNHTSKAARSHPPPLSDRIRR